LTVIACNLREMSGDTLVTLENHPYYHTAKIFKLEDGSIVGGAGGVGLDEMLAWLREGELKGNEPKFDKDVDFIVLRLKQDGIWLYANGVYPDKMHETMFAVGSGVDVAIYAMRHLKKSPADAVREACKVSAGCGGPVEVIKLARKRK
jgi:hypothetical protein